MRSSRLLAVAAAVLFAAIVIPSAVFASSYTGGRYGMVKRQFWGSAAEADTGASYFTIEPGTTNATPDTVGPVFIGNTSYTPGALISTSAVAWLRIVVTGTASHPNADSIYAYTDYANSPQGPWQSQRASIVPPIVLFHGYGAAAADSAGYGVTPSARVPNASYTGVVSISPTAHSPYGFKYVRVRLRGDNDNVIDHCTVDVVPLVDLIPINSTGPR